MNIDTYVQNIMNVDAASERNTYSFTCSSKTLEERAIISYMDYLKANNIAYGRFLKDVLYNAAIDSFDLSLPRKSATITVGSSSAHATGVEIDDVKRLLRMLDNLNEKCDKQSEQISELYNIIEKQTDLIKRLLNNNNNDDIAVTDVVSEVYDSKFTNMHIFKKNRCNCIYFFYNPGNIVLNVCPSISFAIYSRSFIALNSSSLTNI